MWGARRAPGFGEGTEHRLMNKIFVGQPESTWMRIESLRNDEAEDEPVAYGLLVYRDMADGKYVPVTAIDSTLNTKALAVVVDMNVTVPASGEMSCNVAVAGELDQGQICLVDGRLWADFTPTEQYTLKAAMQLWGFALAYVMQA